MKSTWAGARWHSHVNETCIQCPGQRKMRDPYAHLHSTPWEVRGLDTVSACAMAYFRLAQALHPSSDSPRSFRYLPRYLGMSR